MSDKDGTHDDRQQASLLKNEEAMDTRTHSESIQEDADQLLFPAAGPDQEIANMARDQHQQNDESEIGTNPIHDRTGHGKNQMMSVVLISIMLVLVSVTFSQSLSSFIIKKYDNPSPISQDILIVYMLVGFLIIVTMFLRKQVITEKRNRISRHLARNNIRYILRDYLSIVGMSFFFPFACTLDLSHVIAQYGCDEIWRLCGGECYREYLVDLFYHLIRILFMGAELAFCCKFHGTRFKEKGLVRCGLVIVIAANLGLWFLAVVYEAAERDGLLEGEGKKCSNESCHKQSHNMPDNWNACVNKTSSAHKVLDVMIRYLYPFAIEFSLLVGEFLVTMFVSSTKRKAGGPRNSRTTEGNEDFARQSEVPDNDLIVTQQPQRPGNDLVFARQPQTPGDNVVGAQLLSTSVNPGPDQSTSVYASGHPITKLGQLLSVFIIGIGLFANLLYISLAFIDTFADTRNKTEIDSREWVYVYETYSMINYILINALIVVGYVCGYGLEIQEKKLHGLDWLVLISAFGPFMRELITATAIAASYTGLSPTDFPAILIGNRLADWVQLILQAPFIFLSERWRLTERQRSQPRFLCQEKILKAVIFCLAITNLMNWISDSIILTDSFSIKKELIDSIVEFDNWQIVEHISLPFLIFYRFNSFLLFTRAYLGD